MQRTRLLRRLREARDRPVVSIVAPPGYGKTTVLAQWAASESRPVSWLTVDDRDNDPAVFFTDLARALDRQQSLDPAVFDAISSPGLASHSVAGPLALAVAHWAAAVLLIIDDAHRLTGQPCLDALGEFIARLPPSWQVAIAGRDALALPLARWRAQRELLEIGADELAMDDQEAAKLVRGLGLVVPAKDLQNLVRSSGGWPAVIYLAALEAARSPRTRAPAVSVRQPYIADYLRSELLERHSEADINFLTRTSILERLDGSLCDQVLERKGSAAHLVALARSTLLVDETDGWYRYHTLMREFLRDELERREPERLAEIHSRAATWYEGHGFIDRAVDHAFAAGDLDRAAARIAGVALTYHWAGRRATVREWISRFGDGELQKRPWLAILGTYEEAGIGDVASTEHLADVVERGSFEGRPPDGTASFESGRTMLRATLCRAGAADMLTNATLAVELETPGGSWRDFALWTLANARLIGGDVGGADAALADAVAVARANRNHGTWQCALAQRALVAIDRGDWASAASLAEEAGQLVTAAHLDGYQVTATTRAALARIAAHRGDTGTAHAELTRSVTLRPQLTATIPWLNVTALLGLAQAYLAVGDSAGARALLVQAADVVRLRPDLGVLPAQVAALEAQVAALPIALAGASTLTAAELRVLAFLPLYLSVKEIGQRLGVSESTVHTQTKSIYGKLGASSRGEAVELAIQAGLLQALPNWSVTSPISGDAVRRRT